MAFLGLVVMMMMTSGVAGRTYLVETADGGPPTFPHGAAAPHRSAMDHPLEQGIITISTLTWQNLLPYENIFSL